MKIKKCSIDDLASIMQLYDMATVFQKTKNLRNTWQGFDEDVVFKEIQNGNHWKILENNTIACVFVTVFSDPLLWGDKDKDASVYIHRIATNPNFRGKYYVKDIISFCKNELNHMHPID